MGFALRGGKKSKVIGMINDAILGAFKSLKIREDVESKGLAISRIERNAMVRVDFFKRRVGSKSYKVPYMMEAERSYRRSIKTLYRCALRNKGPALDRLIKELVDVYNGTGRTMSEKSSVYALAAQNRMYTYLIRSFKLSNPDALKLDLNPDRDRSGTV
ncbi:MAG: hypothetical protein GY771_09320 [bacterium]|nr:hypothetical protein [bacterium]